MSTITKMFAMSACMMMVGAPSAIASEVSDELAEMRAMVEQLQGQVEAQSEQIDHQGNVIREARLEQTREDDSRFGTSGITSWWSKPSSATWNDAAMLKMARPCWMATTRRVVKLRPSRMRSTS